LYEFAEQFCSFEDYVATSWHNEEANKQVKIGFNEPVLNRNILLRYLNAEPFDSIHKPYLNTQKTVLSEDKFAIRQSYLVSDTKLEPFQFRLGYHPLSEHMLLESAYLDSKLSQLFSPALVEPILRSLCSDDYSLSLKQLDMRFSLSSLPKQSLPSREELIRVFGKAEEITIGSSDEQSLRYEFDFLTQDKQQNWQAQQKPITMLFSFDARNQLKGLYIHYHKYSYWLDVEHLSGRLLVIRRA
tara:strand:- start:259 stop:987 length:729 start_codon:yes stop_codon:yes gene_type:complete